MSFSTGKYKELHLGENEPNAIHKMLVSKPSFLAQERDLGVVGEKSLKTSVQCVVGIIKRQQILNMVKKIEIKYDIILFPFFKKVLYPHH